MATRSSCCSEQDSRERPWVVGLFDIVTPLVRLAELVV